METAASKTICFLIMFYFIARPGQNPGLALQDLNSVHCA
jgi:hypothetical protein